MTKKDWSSIHGEVKEAESMKSHCGDVGSRMEQNKEGKTLTALSCLLIIYIYMCVCVCVFMHCENKGLLNACMIENEMCVFS